MKSLTFQIYFFYNCIHLEVFELGVKFGLNNSKSYLYYKYVTLQNIGYLLEYFKMEYTTGLKIIRVKHIMVCNSLMSDT